MAVTGDIRMEFCRLCQNCLGNITLHHNEEFVNKITQVTKVKVNDELNNYLPMVVCLSCQEKILDFYNYVQVIQKVDENLRSAVKKKYFPESDKAVSNSNHNRIFNNIYKCQECTASFADSNLLESHTKSHKEKTDNYKCTVCSKLYNRERNYNLHIRSHPELYCTACSKTFDEETERNNHLCIHSINNETACIERQRNRRVKLKKAIPILKIKIGETFQCSTCDKKFKNKSSLRQHLKIHRSFACTQKNCLKELPSAYSLKIHQLDHLGKRLYLCVTCGKSFRTKSLLSCHEKIHSEVKGYKCDVCNIGFSVRSNLRAHEKKYHEGIRFYCSQCTKDFMSKCSLERHEKIHIGIKEFKCEHCTSAFYTNKELLKHQRYHQGLKQHKCEECFKTFFERHHLIIHLRSHSGERPYVCKIPECGKAFADSQKLKRHHTAKHIAIG